MKRIGRYTKVREDSFQKADAVSGQKPPFGTESEEVE